MHVIKYEYIMSKNHIQHWQYYKLPLVRRAPLFSFYYNDKHYTT